MRPEHMSPQMSPIAFSLDDPKNGANSFQSLLASPTKFKLDSNIDASANNHANNIYRTSLSKLSELSRTGRSRQRSNSDTLRSVSPIRFQLFSSAPKMLRPEYISQQSSASPLLSTLMRNATTQSANNTGTIHQRDLAGSKVGIRETLEQIQREQRELLQRQEEVNKKNTDKNRELLQPQPQPQQYQQHCQPPKDRCGSKPAVAVHESKLPQTSTGKCAVTSGKSKAVAEETNGNKEFNARFEDSIDIRSISNPSSLPSTITVDLNDISRDMDIELLATDKNGFSSFGESKSNRYSFISSSSTDYDGGEWCNNQPEARNNQMEETAKLDHRIKQLEVEIDNLKLQNEKLIQSITTSRVVEDSFTRGASKETRHSKQKVQQGMERKVKQLEKRVENYRKAMKSCGDSPTELPSESFIMDYKSMASKRRITRISSGELRKIDEQGDSSGSSSEEERDGQSIKHEDYNDSTLTKELFRQDCSDHSSMRRKQGLQLNIQVQTQRSRN